MELFLPSDESVQAVRITNETPSRVAVFDVIKAVTKQTLNNCRTIFYGLQRAHPELAGLTSQFNFPGLGRKETHVADTKGIVSNMMR